MQQSIYSPSSHTHPTHSTVKTTGSLVNSTVKSPRRQQPQVPRRRSLEKIGRQVRLEEDDKLDSQLPISQQHQQLNATDKSGFKQTTTSATDSIDEHGNRKDSYESYTTSLGDEEDREMEYYEDPNWYSKDQQQQQQWNTNNQWLTQQQQKAAAAGRSLPQQPNKPNYFDQQQVYPQDQFTPQQPQQRPFYDQQFNNKENERPQQQQQTTNFMDLVPQQQQQLALTPTLPQTHQQLSPLAPTKLTNELLSDPQYIDQQQGLDASNNDNKKEQWRQNKNETSVWQTVSEDENYDDHFMEQHLQQQKQKQAFGVLQPALKEEEPLSYYDQNLSTIGSSKQETLDQSSLDLMNQNEKVEMMQDAQQQRQLKLDQEQMNDQFDKREQWKNLPDQSSLWQTAESDDNNLQFDNNTMLDSKQNEQQQQDDSTLSMLGGLTTQQQQQKSMLDNYENVDSIAYDEQAENEKLFDQFDINKQQQKQISQPPSALRNQNLIGFSEPKTVTFSDHVQEESYDIISEGGSTTKSFDQKQIRTDPYTGQPIIDNELSYLEDVQSDQTLNKLTTVNELNEQDSTSDYLGFGEQPQQQKRSSLIDITTDQQLIGQTNTQLIGFTNQELPTQTTEQQSGLIEFAPSNTEGMTASRVKWISAFNKIVAEMQEVSF